MSKNTILLTNENLKHKIVASYLLKLNSKNISHFFLNESNLTKEIQNFVFLKSDEFELDLFKIKDFFVQFDENELFSKDALGTLSCILSSSESSNKLLFHSYAQNAKPVFKTTRKFFLENSNNSDLYSALTYLNHTGLTNCFKKDLAILIYIFKN